MRDQLGPDDKRWSSPLTLYIARRLASLAPAGGAVLDIGCGTGTTLEQMDGLDLELHGYDLASRDFEYDEERRHRLQPIVGEAYDSRIKVTTSQREIPFDNAMFDVVYASQVFEHIRFLDPMLSEAARVLKPGGTLLINFPLATSPIEGHLGVPLAHWLPPGPLRVDYLRIMTRLGCLRWRQEAIGKGSRRNGIEWDAYLSEHTYYRFMNEILQVADEHFESSEVETGALLDAKLDLMRVSSSSRQTRLARVLTRLNRQGFVADAVTHLVNAAFRMTGPMRPAAES